MNHPTTAEYLLTGHAYLPAPSPDRIPVGMTAYEAAVSESNTRRLYTEPEDLNAQDWEDGSCPLVTSQAFKWGTDGWVVSVRVSEFEEGYEVVVTLHGELVHYTRALPLDEALVLFRDAEQFVAEALCYELARTKRHLDPYLQSWDSREYLRALDARWRFQAFTGMHVEVVNALLANDVTQDELEVIATTFGGGRRTALENYFEFVLRLDPPWLDRAAIPNSPLAWLATTEEFSRLLAPGNARL